MRKVTKKTNKSEKSKKRDEENESEIINDADAAEAEEEKADASENGETEDNGADDKEKAEEEDEKEEEDDEEDEQYEVQKIIDHKIEKGVSFYLIRWKGYGEDDDTWEAEETIDAEDAIAAFKKRQESDVKNSNKKAGPKSKTKQGGSSKNVKNNEKQKQSTKGSTKGKKRNAPSDSEEEYEVEKIVEVGEDDDTGERVFRIRWKGFPSSKDTWEPESNLTCDALIQKFFRDAKRSEKAGSVEAKELRENRKTTERLPTSQLKGKSSRRLHGKVRKVYYDAE